jgi:hypothetical protein
MAAEAAGTFRLPTSVASGIVTSRPMRERSQQRSWWRWTGGRGPETWREGALSSRVRHASLAALLVAFAAVAGGVALPAQAAAVRAPVRTRHGRLPAARPPAR